MKVLCWWCWCVTVTTSAAAAAAAASGQGQCEVLDLSLYSSYSQPTNLTLKPSTEQWRLDVVLQGNTSQDTPCFRLEKRPSKVRVLLYEGTCEEGQLSDFQAVRWSVSPDTWTLVGVAVRDNTLVVTRPGAHPVTLEGKTASSLPHDALRVTAARDVEVAVGCGNSCPHYNLSSSGTKNAMTSRQDKALFYFVPGAAFVTVECRTSCTTSLGNLQHTQVLHHNESRQQWRLLELLHHEGGVEVTLDYTLLKQQQLPKSCVFKEHRVKVTRNSLYATNCDPDITAPAYVPKADAWSYSSSTHACLHAALWVVTLITMTQAL